MSNSQELPAGVPELTREELNWLILICDEPDSESDLLAAYALGAQRAAEARLDAIPEGCTPADAAVLRDVNHQLAAEVEALRADAERWRMQIALDEEALRQPKSRKMQQCLDAFNEALDMGLIREAAIDAAIKDAAWSGVTTYMLGVTPEEEAEWQRKSDELDARRP